MNNKDFQNENTELIMQSEPAAPAQDPSLLSSDEIASAEGRANIAKMPTAEDAAKMNYVELQSAISDMEEIIRRGSDTMAIVENLDSFFVDGEPDESLVDAIGMSMEEFMKLKSEQESFKKAYEEKMPQHHKILDMLRKTVEDKYGSQEKTTSFMVEQLKDAFQKRIAMMNDLISATTNEKSRAVYTDRKNNLEAICKILDDREELSYWTKRYSQPLVIHNTWISVRKDFDHTIAYIKKHLTKTFHPVTLEMVYNTMIIECESDATPMAAICLLYDMAKCTRFGKESKEAWNVRNLFTVITDMNLGRYDYHCENTRADGINWVSTLLFAMLRIFSIEIMKDHDGKKLVELYKAHPKLIEDAKERMRRIESAVESIKTEENSVDSDSSNANESTEDATQP